MKITIEDIESSIKTCTNIINNKSSDEETKQTFLKEKIRFESILEKVKNGKITLPNG